MKNTQTNKKINLAQINFDFFNAKQVYEQNKICFICAQKTYLFGKKKKQFFFRIVCKSRDYQNLFQCLYQNYSKFFFLLLFSLSTLYTHPS